MGIIRRSVDRDLAKSCITFLGRPMGRALHAKLKEAYDAWKDSKDGKAPVVEVAGLAEHFGKERTVAASRKRLRRENLELICFEYVSG